MNKIFKKLLSLTLCLIMVCSVMPFAVLGAGAEEKTYAVGETIEFGSYPQTEVKDTAITDELKKLAGNTDTWTSYNYMADENTVGDYMKYKDVTYNGEKYRGVYFSLYRPYYTIYTASTSASTYQDDNLYTYGNTYWFKFEPIEWVILEAGTGGLAVCKNILDSQAYCDTNYSYNSNYYGDSSHSYYCNNWEHSTIRTWLNSTFINTAFTASQQNNIVETTIKTPAYSTSYSQYDSADTSDKVFLLSYDDVQNTAYGFVSGTSSSTTRQKTSTDYAKSQGLWENSLNGYSYWRLRSAGGFSRNTCYVYYSGNVNYSNYTFNTGNGVVAALYFQSYNPDTLGICATHSYQSVVTAPTCTEQGYTTHICTKCRDSYVDTYVEAGHDYVDHDAKPATCTEIGWNAYKTCKNCDYTTYSEISAKGHEYVDHDAKAATCTEIGWNAYQTCKNCDYTSYVEIPVKGHDYVDHEAQAATCTEIGWDAYQTCKNCEYTSYIEISATGHNWSEWTDGVRACKNENCDAIEECTHEGVNAGEICPTCGTVLPEATVSSYSTATLIIAIITLFLTLFGFIAARTMAD